MSDFFENNIVENVLERHVKELSSLEKEEIGRIFDLYKRVRSDIRDRLDAIPSGTFTAQRLSGVLAQVDSGLMEMARILKSDVSESGQKFAELGVNQLLREIKKFEKEFTGAVVPISVDSVAIASDASNFLFNKYEASIDAYSGQLRSMFAQNLSQAAIEEISTGEVVQRIGKYFLTEEWRLQRLVRTEMMGIYSFGKLKGMQEIQENDLPDLMKTLYHPMDSRTGEDTKILAKHNPIVPINEPFIESSTGKEIRYMAPPNRPNDRAVLIPYRESWAK